MSRPISQAYPYGIPIASGVIPDGPTVSESDFAPYIADVSDAICDALGDTDWSKPVSLSNSWIAYNTNFVDPNYPPPPGVRYRRIGQHVMLSGLIKSGATGGTLFTLPVGYRPAFMIQHAAVAGGGTCMVYIAATGVVSLSGFYFHGGNNGYVSLDGIAFLRD